MFYAKPTGELRSRISVTRRDIPVNRVVEYRCNGCLSFTSGLLLVTDDNLFGVVTATDELSDGGEVRAITDPDVVLCTVLECSQSQWTHGATDNYMTIHKANAMLEDVCVTAADNQELIRARALNALCRTDVEFAQLRDRVAVFERHWSADASPPELLAAKELLGAGRTYETINEEAGLHTLYTYDGKENFVKTTTLADVQLEETVRCPTWMLQILNRFASPTTAGPDDCDVYLRTYAALEVYVVLRTGRVCFRVDAPGLGPVTLPYITHVAHALREGVRNGERVCYLTK